MLDDRKICSAAVDKCSNELALSAGNASERIAGRIKNQRSSLSQDIGTDPEPRRRWQRNYQAAGRLMDVGLNPGQTGGSKILLCIATVTVHAFRGEPTVEVGPGPDEEPTIFSTPLRRVTPGRVFCEKACALQADL